MEGITSKKHIEWIDVAKGIAMLSVVIGHVNGGQIGKVNLSFVYGYELSVFFLLSGYTLKVEPLTKDYIQKKFTRLMVPYFYTCTAVMLFWIVRYDRTIIEVTSRIRYCLGISFFASGEMTNFGNIDFGGFIGAIWFLPAMLFSLVFSQAVLNVIKSDKMQPVIFACLFIIGTIFREYIWLPYSIQPAMTATIFIYVGYCIKKYEMLKKAGFLFYSACFLCFIIGIYFQWDHYYIVGAYYRDLVMSPITGVAGAFTVIGIAKHLEDVDYLRFVGRNSLYFMCIHLIVLNCCMDWADALTSWAKISSDYYLWGHVAFHIVVESIFTWIIVLLKEKDLIGKYKRIVSSVIKKSDDERDLMIDIYRGLLILIMILGNASIDSELRKIIFSFHMAAFVMLSGIYYKPDRGYWKSFFKLIQNFLIPYLLFCFLDFIISFGSRKWTIVESLKYYVLGISYANKYFNDIPSVGPVYFLLLLFLIRLLYMTITRMIKNDWSIFFVVLLISYIGVVLGKNGIWLPWSLDIALYSMIFYHLGYIIKKYGIIEYVYENKWIYFFLTPVWVYMAHEFSMEIAIRQYEPYGIVIAGAFCAFLVVLSWARHICQLQLLSNLLSLIGRYTVYVLICHDCMQGYIWNWLINIRGKNPESIVFFFRLCFCQVLIGVIGGIIWEQIVGFLSRSLIRKNNYA